MIRITETDVGTGIPYPPACRENGARNFGYLDLKRFPHLIHQIPELRDSPALFAIVQRLNSPDSVFRTLGCNWQTNRAYIQIAFEILHWNRTGTAFRRLSTDCSRWYAANFSEPPAADVEFRIGPVSYRDCGFEGWAVSIHVSSPEQQLDAVETCLRRLEMFLSFTSASFQPQLRGCLSTLSDIDHSSSRPNAMAD